MTSHWNDIANSDCIFMIGSNPAENHPAAFGHITAAKDKGAKVISVDPRFTRSSAKADVYAPIRSGTDVAFVGGMIKYVLDDIETNPGNYNMVYITEYTNAAYLVNPAFKGPADLDGLFSGYAGSLNETDQTKRTYGKATWSYQVGEDGVPLKDKSLKNPNSVFQLLKKQYARYTPAKINAICGTPQDAFLEICRTYAATGKVGKAGVIIYAMGTTQHTNGTQNIRTYAILQLLLGNIGVAGGGIDAARGESNVQGSTDFGLLFDSIPGYLGMCNQTDSTLQKYLDRLTPKTSDPLSANWLQNYPKYITSLLKAWWGESATKDNDFAFGNMPKIDSTKNYSFIAMFEAMEAGTLKGLLAWGQNPAVGGPNGGMERKALEKLEWLVATDLWETETAAFWKRPGVDPATIQTEVFMLPALASMEKEGSITNSGRWMQWRYKAADGPGEAEDDLWMINKLMLKLKGLYSSAGGPLADSITKMVWNYGDPPDVRKVAKEVNGYDTTTGKQIDGFANLKSDGTTACGEWVYCGSYVEPTGAPTAPIPGNRASRRDNVDTSGIQLYSNWAWSWPVNRRIIYNRASVDLDGKPFDTKRPVVQWKDGKWVGDVVDGGYAPPSATGGKLPFIMTSEGVARLFASGLVDGPFAEFYEPWESPVTNQLSKEQSNPIFKIWRPAEKGSKDTYPIVGTTYRVCEHWQAGQMTRNLPWLNEMMPEPFVEMSEELAAEKGISNGDKVIVKSARGQVTVVAVVTKRFKPLQMNGNKVHEVGLVWHWGYTGLSTGDSANLLTAHVGDANTMIPEYKAFLVDIQKA